MKIDKINPIIIQIASATQNDLGNPVGNTYTDVITLMAAYETKYGRSFYAAEEVHKTIDCRFTVWYDVNLQINENMYVFYNNSRYVILAVNDVNGLHREVELYCKRAV